MHACLYTFSLCVRVSLSLLLLKLTPPPTHTHTQAGRTESSLGARTSVSSSVGGDFALDYEAMTDAELISAIDAADWRLDEGPDEDGRGSIA